jgi:hypothetical protein
MPYTARLAIENASTFSIAVVDGPVAFRRGGAVPVPFYALNHNARSLLPVQWLFRQASGAGAAFPSRACRTFMLDKPHAQAYSSSYESAI